MVTRQVVAKLDRIDAAAAALTGVVRAAPGSRRQVPATPAWSIAEVYAHVAAEVPRYEADALGNGTRVADVGALADENVGFVASIATSSIDDIDQGLADGLRTLRSTFTGFGDQLPTVTFDGGAVMSADVALGALLGEFLVHGYDIACVCGRRWDFEPDDVGIVLEALNALAPHWVNPAATAHHTATYELNIGRRRHIAGLVTTYADYCHMGSSPSGRPRVRTTWRVLQPIWLRTAWTNSSRASSMGCRRLTQGRGSSGPLINTLDARQVASSMA